jgi:2-keto-4-pentenoate hydratase/2-oxohepta-3-ene-1,7-dioic acid hydratase in catechol pathway
MRFIAFRQDGKRGLAIEQNGDLLGIFADQSSFPGTLDDIIQNGGSLEGAAKRLAHGRRIDAAAIEKLPPFNNPSKIICIGLNYVDHSVESGFVPPTYPTVFARFASSLVGDGEPILRPTVSGDLDYEAEMVAVIGKGGRKISAADALDHVAGYSVFNDASVRDYQFKSPQWTVGKNFDATGAFGPVFVTADELPPGGKGLKIQTRLNGQVVQSDNTDNMIFSVAKLVEILSEAMTLEPGDLIVSGTPSGVGMARKPKLYMKPGDVCEVEIERIGILRNPIAAETESV